MTFTVLAPNVAPVASFTRDVDEPAAVQVVTFTDTSTDRDGTIASRAWDLDDDGAYDDGTGATAATRVRHGRGPTPCGCGSPTTAATAPRRP